MQSVRKVEGLFKAVWHMQDMFQDTCPERPDPWRDKIQLVEVGNYDDGSDCRYANKNQECQHG